MSVLQLCLYITVALLSIYSVMSGIECGLALVRLWPNFSTDSPRQLSRLTALWEITNVFLVFGITAFVIFFNNALVPVSRVLLPSLAIALVALLARACLMLFVAYRDVAPGLRVSNALLAICTFAIPLTFATGGIYLLGGQFFWQTPAGWTLFGAAATGLGAVGLSSVIASERERLRRLPFWSFSLIFLVWLALLGTILPLTLNHNSSLRHLLQMPFNWVVLLCDIALIAFAALLLVRRLNWVWIITIPSALSFPILLTWAQWPYLSYPNITAAHAYGAAAFARIVLIGLAVSAPFLAGGFWLLFRLLRSSEGSDSNQAKIS